MQELVENRTEEIGVEYAVFGAVAMGLHGLARSTGGPRSVRGAVAGKCGAGQAGTAFVFDDSEIEGIRHDDLGGEYSAVRYVEKYRSVTDMPGPPRRRPGDPELCRALAGLRELAHRSYPRRYRPGTYRFRSIRELDASQDHFQSE